MNKTVPLINWFKYLLRIIYPIPKPPIIDSTKDICKVELVPYVDLLKFYERSLDKFLLNRKDLIHLEFGVFNGTSLAVAYNFYNNLNMKNYRIIGFDSFKGLPKECENEDGGVWKEGMYSCTKDQTKTCLISRGVDSQKIEIVEGWYKDTLNYKTANFLSLNHVNVVFIDCDAYSSCRLVLDFIKPLIKDTVLICFDDWKLNDLDLYEMGESKAFKEFINQDVNYKTIEIKSYNRKSKCFLLSKIT